MSLSVEMKVFFEKVASKILVWPVTCTMFF